MGFLTFMHFFENGGVWRPLLPNMLVEFTDEPVSVHDSVCSEIVANAALNHFEGIKLPDVNEVLEATNHDLSNEELVEMNELNELNLLIVNQSEEIEPDQLKPTDIFNA